jgi:TonB family protein
MKRGSVNHDDLAVLLPDFEILAEVGRGGLSAVYLARERELNREVAIKVIRNQFLGDEEARVRVDREAHTLAKLRHPNIVTLLGARRLADGRLALVMQYTQGQTLRAAVEQNGPFPYEKVLSVTCQVASALGYVHGRGFVHRDVKPENIFIEDDGHILLSDLGIAKATDAMTSVTLTGVIVGTPTYMSPEQIDGGHLDGRSDLYSLGLVAYELLTGKRPWDGESLFSVILKQKTEALPSLGDLRPDVPVHFRTAIERALAKQPEDRWASMEEFIEQIEPWMNDPVPAPHLQSEEPPVPVVAPVAVPTAPLQERRASEAEQTIRMLRPQKKRRSARTMAIAAVLVLFAGGGAAISASSRLQQALAPGATALLSAPTSSEPAAQPLASPAIIAPAAVPKEEPTEEPDTAVEAVTSDAAEAARQDSIAARNAARWRAERAARQALEEEEERQEAEYALLSSSDLLGAATVIQRQPEPTSGPRTSTVVQPLPRLTPPQLLNAAALRGHITSLYQSTFPASRVGGTVTLDLTIDEEGRVSERALARSSGNAEIDEIALRVATRMRFSPALLNGVPVTRKFQVPLIIQP